jgi:hypothetical protein
MVTIQHSSRNSHIRRQTLIEHVKYVIIYHETY